MAFDRTADSHRADRTTVVHALDAQANVTVVDQNIVARLEHLAHDRRGHRQVDLRALRPDEHLLAFRDRHGSGEVSDAQLRPLQVGDERQGAAVLPLDVPHCSRPLRMLSLRAVREVEPNRIRSGVHDLVDAACRRRAERGDDLRPARYLEGHPVQRTVACERYR